MMRNYALLIFASVALQGCLSSPRNDTNISSKCLGPAYPKDALAAKEEGTVTMDLLISTTGSVVQSKIITSSGFPDLDDAAVAGLTKCHFKPMTYYNGTPMEGWKTLQYVWKVDHRGDDD